MASLSIKKSNRKKIRRTENLMDLNLLCDNDDDNIPTIENFSANSTPEKTIKNKKHDERRTKRILRSTVTDSSEELKENDQEIVVKKKKKTTKKKKNVKGYNQDNDLTDIDTELTIKVNKPKKKKSKKDNCLQSLSDEHSIESNLSATSDVSSDTKKSKKKGKKNFKSVLGSELKRKAKNQAINELEETSESNILNSSSKEKCKKTCKLEKSYENHSSEELPEVDEPKADKNSSISENKAEKSKRNRFVRQDAINSQRLSVYSDISGCEDLEESFNKSKGLLIDSQSAETLLKKSLNNTFQYENVETNISKISNKSNRKSSLSKLLLTSFNNLLEENSDGTNKIIQPNSVIPIENNDIEANAGFISKEITETQLKNCHSNQNISIDKIQQDAEVSRTVINTKSPKQKIPEEKPLTGRKKWSIQSTEPDWYETFKNIAPSCSSNSSVNNDIIEIVSTTDSFSTICDLSDIKNETTPEIVPSKCGEVESHERRRTYELEKSVNEVALLKDLSQSIQQTSFNQDENLFSKITLRRKNNNENMLLDNITLPCNSSLSAESPTINSIKLSQNKGKRASLGRISRSLSNTPMKDFASPKNRTSTPLQRRKSQNLLKDVLTKDKLFENISSISNISNVSASMKFQSKIKPMPNFTAIHQKALNKLEDISQYQQRKADRAQFLLSGQKPMNKTFSPKPKQSIKQLRFDGTADTKEKPKNFIPLPSTPKPRFVNKIKCNSPMPMQVGISTMPEFKCATPKFNIGINPTEKKSMNASGKKKHDKFKNRLPVRIVKENKENKPSVRIVTQKVNNLNNLKEIVTKEISKTSDRRNVIKGVRSNRRFDLLMKMRENKS